MTPPLPEPGEMVLMCEHANPDQEMCWTYTTEPATLQRSDGSTAQFRFILKCPPCHRKYQAGEPVHLRELPWMWQSTHWESHSEPKPEESFGIAPKPSGKALLGNLRAVFKGTKN